MSLLESSQLSDLLEGEGHYAILAPSNDAFERLPPAFAEMITYNDDDLRKVNHSPFTRFLIYSLENRKHFVSFVMQAISYHIVSRRSVSFCTQTITKFP